SRASAGRSICSGTPSTVTPSSPPSPRWRRAWARASRLITMLSFGAPRAPAPFSHPRYEAGQELGRGGQGVVVRAVDREAPQRPLVAKVFRAGAFLEHALLG